MPANPLVTDIHAKGRMPAMALASRCTAWLKAGPEDARAMLPPFPADQMDAYPVSTRVNSPRNDGPDLVEPIGPEQAASALCLIGSWRIDYIHKGNPAAQFATANQEARSPMNVLPSRRPLRLASLLICLSLTSLQVGAQDFDPGRALYENHCQQCHAGWVHTREGRKVTRLDDLHARVGAWSVHAGLHWTSEEIDAVTRYVNRRFYQLTE